MSNILCRIFGHKISEAFTPDGYKRYFYTTGSGPLDGLNTRHLDLYCRCDRCDEKFMAGAIHATEDGNILPRKLREEEDTEKSFERKLNDFLKRQKYPEPEMMEVLNKTFSKMRSDKPTRL